MFVRTISSEPQNMLLPNLVWLCSMISQSVMQKIRFTVFNVKVKARAYIIKIWLFLLYLLNSWWVCDQIWFNSTTSIRSVLWKNGITVFKVAAKVQDVSECLYDIFSLCLIVSAQYLLNCSTSFCFQTWYGGILSRGDLSCGKIGSLSSISRSQRGLM